MPCVYVCPHFRFHKFVLLRSIFLVVVFSRYRHGRIDGRNQVHPYQYENTSRQLCRATVPHGSFSNRNGLGKQLKAWRITTWRRLPLAAASQIISSGCNHSSDALVSFKRPILIMLIEIASTALNHCVYVPACKGEFAKPSLSWVPLPYYIDRESWVFHTANLRFLSTNDIVKGRTLQNPAKCQSLRRLI